MPVPMPFLVPMPVEKLMLIPVPMSIAVSLSRPNAGSCTNSSPNTYNHTKSMATASTDEHWVFLFVHVRCCTCHKYQFEWNWLRTLRIKSLWFWRERSLQRWNLRWQYSLLRAVHSGNGYSRRRLHSHDRVRNSIYGRKRQRQCVTSVRGYIFRLWNFWWVVIVFDAFDRNMIHSYYLFCNNYTFRSL